VEFDVPGVPPFLHEHAFNPGLAIGSLAVALLGIGAASAYYYRGAFQGLAAKVPVLQAGHRILVHKYYLDDLFLAIIRGIQYPVARAAYWVNQHVLDGVINGVGKGAQAGAHLIYDVVDQRVIDGAVNGAGFGAEEGGSILRDVQTGRVQQYAALLFGASALFAVGLVLLT
jgi:NADH-quinone oxidoreductase subunit L